MRRLVSLGWTFFWINTFTLGGGMAMLPLLDREFVERRKWLTSQEMLDVIAVMQSLPGLIAINMAVLIGYKVKGVAGALVAAFASAFTPFVVIAVIARYMSELSTSPVLSHIFLGVRAGTAALVLMSLMKLSRTALIGAVAWFLATGGFLASVVFRVDLTWVILFGLATGLCMVIANAIRKARQ